MRNQSHGLFLVFCLMLVIGLMHSFHRFQNYFSPEKDLRRQISRMDADLARQKLQVALAENQLRDYQYQVAQVLPEQLSKAKNSEKYQLRSLASVSRKSFDAFDFSGGLMDEAKNKFNQKRYDQAIKTLKTLMDQYPASPRVIEAHFFMAESLYLLGKTQECLDVIEQMMAVFPDHELTGYIMLRMGQVLEERSRLDEATSVYETVQNSFADNKLLAQQAAQLEKNVK
jgi:TolA-binding protein